MRGLEAVWRAARYLGLPLGRMSPKTVGALATYLHHHVSYSDVIPYFKPS